MGGVVRGTEVSGDQIQWNTNEKDNPGNNFNRIWKMNVLHF